MKTVSLRPRWAAVAALLSGSFFSIQAYAACDSSGNNTYYEWIQNIQVADYSNNSGKSNGYADYTSQTINLEPGSHSVALTPGFRGGSYSEYWRIWIDLNQDGSLGTDELVFSGVSSSQASGNLTIPADALTGNTLMRISMKYGGAPQACGSFTYGEVEDYTVHIGGGDTQAPTVVTTTPADNATDIELDSLISVVFSEDIDGNSIDASNFSISQGGIDIQGEIAVNGSTATFTPSQLLDPENVYEVALAAGISDLNGNTMTDSTNWSFTTKVVDTTAPVVKFTSPQDQEQGVANSFVIQAKFSETMDPTTINGASFLISDGSQNIAGTINYSSGFAQFYPSQPLAYSTEYTATLTTAITDQAGNSLDTPYQWSFTTEEFVPEYCSSHASTYDLMWIKSVKLGGHTSTLQSNPSSGYSNRTTTIFSMGRYYANSLKLTPEFDSTPLRAYWRVFVDWNKDGVFGVDEVAAETIAESSSPIASTSITIPDAAMAGNTRMRISMKLGSYAEACETIGYGYVVDYRVDVPAP